MKTRARVVVIGGGIAGCSLLYHLTLEGWTDVVLVERDELTSGTTWHSAAQCPNVAFDQLLISLRTYTIDLYRELAADADYPINYHTGMGGMRLLHTQNHVDQANHVVSAGRGVGVDFHLLSPGEAARRHPLLTPDGLKAVLWDERDGHIDPAQLTQALARRARLDGAEIYRQTEVIGLTQHPNSEWTVHTSQGDIDCEIVVNAAGYRVNEVGEMMRVEHPVVSMEHMFMLTEPVAGLTEDPVPMVRCPVDTFYMRQEQDGLLLGVYEFTPKTFGTDGIDPDFTNALCPPDLDRCLEKLEAMALRIPAVGEVGLTSIVNGPIAYAPDAGPLVGKTPGVRNAYSMTGIRVGIGEGGGYGKALAQLIVHGEAAWDVWPLDPRRIGDHATQTYTAAKAIEDYQMEFQWHFPHEHRSAGRPAKSTPLYEVYQGLNAEFSVVNGWERTAYFKPAPEFHEAHTYHRPDWHDAVGAEIEALTTGAGVMELSGFNRFQITGTGVLEWLATLTPSRVPDRRGRVRLVYFLTDGGGVLGEATLSLRHDGTIWYCSAAAAELHDMDWLHERIPEGSDIEIESLTNSWTTLVVAGSRSDAVLASITDDASWLDVPWMSVVDATVAGIDVVVLSVSFTGERAWELHVPNEHLVEVHRAVSDEGAAQVGSYAIESMRLEKGYGHWKADFLTEYSPYESALDRFMTSSSEYPGRAALAERPVRWRRVLLELDGIVPAQPDNAIQRDGEVVGVVTSAAWGFRTNANLAMAYLHARFGIGSAVEVMLLGEHVNAIVRPLGLFDPENHRPRGLPVEQSMP